MVAYLVTTFVQRLCGEQVENHVPAELETAHSPQRPVNPKEAEKSSTTVSCSSGI